jgi:hypothetical protein
MELLSIIRPVLNLGRLMLAHRFKAAKTFQRGPKYPRTDHTEAGAVLRTYSSALHRPSKKSGVEWEPPFCR